MNEPKFEVTEVFQKSRAQEMLDRAAREEQMVKFSQTVYRHIQAHGRQYGHKPSVILMNQRNIFDLPHSPYYLTADMSGAREIAFMGIPIRRCLDIEPDTCEVY